MHLQRMPNHETNVYLYSERKILTVPKSFGKLDAVKVNNKTKMRKIMENAIKMVHFNLTTSITSILLRTSVILSFKN